MVPTESQPAAGRVVLKTFVQVSDLHVGDIDPQTGDAQVSAAAAQAFQKLRFLSGVLDGLLGLAVH